MLAASAAGVCQACKDPRFKKKNMAEVAEGISADDHMAADVTWL